MIDQTPVSARRCGWYKLSLWIRVPVAYLVGIAVALGVLITGGYVLVRSTGGEPIFSGFPILVALSVQLLRGAVTVILIGQKWLLHGLITAGLVFCETIVIVSIFMQWPEPHTSMLTLTIMLIILAAGFPQAGSAVLGALVGGQLVKKFRGG